MSKITEIITEPSKIEIGSLFLLKIKVTEPNSNLRINKNIRRNKKLKGE